MTKRITREEYFIKAAGQEIVMRARRLARSMNWPIRQILDQPKWRKVWEGPVDEIKIQRLSKREAINRRKMNVIHERHQKELKPFYEKRNVLDAEVRKLRNANSRPELAQNFAIWFLDVQARQPERIDKADRADDTMQALAELYVKDVLADKWTPGKVTVTMEVK